MSECPRVGKFFGGCRFEPRYDVKAPDASRIGRIEGFGSILPIIEAARPTTYVQDICTRCGKTVQRPNPTPANGEA